MLKQKDIRDWMAQFWPNSWCNSHHAASDRFNLICIINGISTINKIEIILYFIIRFVIIIHIVEFRSMFVDG